MTDKLDVAEGRRLQSLAKGATSADPWHDFDEWWRDNADALLTAAEERDQAVRERDEARDAVRVWNERWNKAQDELDVFRTTQFREDWWRAKAEFSEAALDSLRAELERERARAEALRAELRIIAEAAPSKWEADMRDQFQAWAQSRAHFALAQEAGRDK